MADQQEPPDHTEDPREQEVGEGGHPETTPSGSTPDEDADEGDDEPLHARPPA